MYATDSSVFQIDNDKPAHNQLTIISKPEEILTKIADDIDGFTIMPINLVKHRCDVKVLTIDSISPYIERKKSGAECKNEVNIEAIRTKKYHKVPALRVVIRTDDPVMEKVGKAFITILMTNEGQGIIKSAGYSPITD
jgi:hypothetical protein